MKTTMPVIKNVPEHPPYNAIALQDLEARGREYYGTRRLTKWSLSEAFASLMSKWYRKEKCLDIESHLVIPPELIFTISEIFKEPYAIHFIGGIWIDTNIEVSYPNCPWFLFASPRFIIGDEVGMDGVYYSTGTVPSF